MGYLRLLIFIIILPIHAKDLPYTFPEQRDIEYMMDLWMGTPLWDWQRDYQSWDSGMIVSMGCFSMHDFYVHTDLKIERNLWEGLNFRFRYQTDDRIDRTDYKREFDLLWQFKQGPRFSLLLFPEFDKKKSDVGISLGYHIDKLPNIAKIRCDLGIIANKFDNNFSYSEGDYDKQMIFSRYPVTYFAELYYCPNPISQTVFNLYFTRKSKAEHTILTEPDSSYYELDKRVVLSGFQQVRINQRWMLGLKANYNLDYNEETKHKDYTKDIFFQRETMTFEPMVNYIIKDPKFWVGTSCQFLKETLYRRDSPNIKRTNLLPTVSIANHLFWKFDMVNTYIRSDVNFENYSLDASPRGEGINNRIITMIEMPFASGARFQFRKGWELDRGDDRWGPTFFLYDKIHCHLMVPF